MTQETQASIVASTLRTIDAGGFINTQLDKAATLLVSQDAQILALKEELVAEKRYQRTRDAAAVRTLSALGYDWHGGDSWQAAPKAVAETEKEQIQALMDKHQIWIQQTTYEELDRPPYDLFAVQAEQHQFEAFVQDLIALSTNRPASLALITTLENIAHKYATDLRNAACATYAEDTERMARNAKSALTESLQDELSKHSVMQEIDVKAMSAWLLARRSHLGSSRESAENWCEHWGAKNWDNYTMLSKYFAAQAKQVGA